MASYEGGECTEYNYFSKDEIQVRRALAKRLGAVDLGVQPAQSSLGKWSYLNHTSVDILVAPHRAIILGQEFINDQWTRGLI